MSIKKKKIIHILSVIIPLIIMIIIYIVSLVMFDRNKKETGEMVSNQLESELNRIVYTVNESIKISEERELTTEQINILKNSMISLNNQTVEPNSTINMVTAEETQNIELVGEKTSIWNKPLNPGSNGSVYNYLGVQDRIQTKMKISVY